MGKAVFVSLLILIPGLPRAKDKKADWQALYSLHSGEQTQVVESGIKKHVGTFSTVTEGQLRDI